MIRRYFACRKMRWAVRRLATMSTDRRRGFRLDRRIMRAYSKGLPHVGIRHYESAVDALAAQRLEKFYYAAREELIRVPWSHKRLDMTRLAMGEYVEREDD